MYGWNKKNNIYSDFYHMCQQIFCQQCKKKLVPPIHETLLHQLELIPQENWMCIDMLPRWQKRIHVAWLCCKKNTNGLPFVELEGTKKEVGKRKPVCLYDQSPMLIGWSVSWTTQWQAMEICGIAWDRSVAVRQSKWC